MCSTSFNLNFISYSSQLDLSILFAIIVLLILRLKKYICVFTFYIFLFHFIHFLCLTNLISFILAVSFILIFMLAYSIKYRFNLKRLLFVPELILIRVIVSFVFCEETKVLIVDSYLFQKTLFDKLNQIIYICLILLFSLFRKKYN